MGNYQIKAMTTYIIQKQAMGTWFVLPSTQQESLDVALKEIEEYRKTESHSIFRLLECSVVKELKPGVVWDARTQTIFTTEEKRARNTETT